MTVTQARIDLRDALQELLVETTVTHGLADMILAANDVSEGELGRKMALVRECADALRAAANLSGMRDIGAQAFPRRTR